MLLDAGILPKGCSVMHEMLRQNLKEHLDEMVEKIKPELAESATPYIIPDPHNILKEGEAMLCVPEGFMDPKTQLPISHISGRDALVARNPANWPSDMQKIKLAWYQELAYLRNVLVFSTKGKQPLADLLSGGDYDGDKAFITWDSEIVDQFRNYSGSSCDQFTPEECGLLHRSEPLSKLFKIPESPSADEINAYLSRCIDFNFQEPLLGMVTHEHAKYVYWKSVGMRGEGRQALQDSGAMMLGALASFLVDVSSRSSSEVVSMLQAN